MLNKKDKFALCAGSMLAVLALTIPTVKATHLISNGLSASIGISASSTSEEQAISSSSNDMPATDTVITSTDQNTSSSASSSNISSVDGTIAPSDLGVSDPTILPDSHFYFLKNWWRGTRLFFTFNPIKKIELENKFANEKLIEAKKIAQKIKDPKVIDKALKNYEESIDKIKKQTKKIKREKKNSQEVNKFLDKFTHQQILHQEILDRLEKKVPPKVFQRIKEAQAKHLNAFKEVMTKLENKDQIPQRLEKAVEKIKKINFPEIKALQMIKKIESNATSSTDIRRKLNEAETRILQRLKTRVQNANMRQREIFGRTLRNKKNEINSLQIIEKLRNEGISTSTRNFLDQVKGKVLRQIIQKNNQKIQKLDKKFTPAKIKDILENPKNWINKKVKINGRIVPSQEVTDKKLAGPPISYYLSDGTGKIGFIGHLPHLNPVAPTALSLKNQKCVPEGHSLGAVVPGNNSKCCPGLVMIRPYRLLGIRGYCINPNHSLTVLGEVKNKGLIQSNDKTNSNFQPYLVAFHTQWNPPITHLVQHHLSPHQIIRHQILRHQKACKDLCGDGICQRVVCLSTGCPCPETPKSCPQDCQKDNTSNISTTTKIETKAKIKQRYESFLHHHLRMPNE
ncbi:MAG TPA: hypothetical protein ENL06_00010 [Candidatus Portnoybacteria bacterium]|nr:hypothetical protein [Candidatus Portnoybacteria bacterium]